MEAIVNENNVSILELEVALEALFSNPTSTIDCFAFDEFISIENHLAELKFYAAQVRKRHRDITFRPVGVPRRAFVSYKRPVVIKQCLKLVRYPWKQKKSKKGEYSHG